LETACEEQGSTPIRSAESFPRGPEGLRSQQRRGISSLVGPEEGLSFDPHFRPDLPKPLRLEEWAKVGTGLYALGLDLIVGA